MRGKNVNQLKRTNSKFSEFYKSNTNKGPLSPENANFGGLSNQLDNLASNLD